MCGPIIFTAYPLLVAPRLRSNAVAEWGYVGIILLAALVPLL